MYVRINVYFLGHLLFKAFLPPPFCLSCFVFSAFITTIFFMNAFFFAPQPLEKFAFDLFIYKLNCQVVFKVGGTSWLYRV